MQKILYKSLLIFLLVFITLNFALEFNKQFNVDIAENVVPNLDSNCYYSKNQIINFFNDKNIGVTDIVKYSENSKCAGKVIGSNLEPGKNLNDIEKIFIISNTSFYNIYFSYSLLASASIAFLLIYLLLNFNNKKIIFSFIVLITILNFNSFLISSYRHNSPSSRLIQFQEFNFDNYKEYSDPKYFLKEFDK